MITVLWPACVALLIAVAMLWHRSQRNHGWPYSTFLFNPDNRFTDLTMTMWAAKRPQPYTPVFLDIIPSYFPLTMWLLRLGPVGWMRIIYLALVAWLTVLWGWVVPLVMLISYPAIHSDDRGNLDHVVAAWSGASVAILFAGHPIIAGLMLGAAAAMKGYPAALGLLWIGYWWGMVALASSIIALVVLPAITFGGGLRVSMAGLRSGNKSFFESSILACNGPAYSTSHYCCDVFSAFRLLSWWRDKEFDSARWIRPCMMLATVWAALLAWIAWTSPHTWVTLLSLGLVQVVWPHVANDYKLMTLAPGIVFWIHAGCPGRILFVCLLLLWVPKHYWFPRPSFTVGSISCVISPILLIGVTVGLWLGR